MAGYIGTQPVPQATQTRDAIVATAGQTSFATGGYTPQFLDVYLNGVHLRDGTDYTAANGSDVVLTVGAALDDVLEVVAYTTFETSNNATLAQGALADSAVQPNDSPAFDTVTVANISDGTDTVETGYVVNGSAKAWVNLNGTGTAAIRGSMNVSSLTDNGIGLYAANFTNSMGSANYMVNVSASTPINSVHTDLLTLAVNSASFGVINNTGSAIARADSTVLCTSTHGDLA
jgi:hypothetical protein